MSQKIALLLSAGGTAGHINPMLSLASYLELEYKNVEIFVLSADTPLERRLLGDVSYKVSTIDKVVLPRKLSLSIFKFPYNLFKIVKNVNKLLKYNDIDIVVGFGGYVSGPAYLAAKFRRIPIIVHESNIEVGWANKLGAFLTKYRAVAFKGVKLSNSTLVGMPMRSAIGNIRLDSSVKLSSRNNLGLDRHMPTLVVTGGSSGAVAINNVITDLAPVLVTWGVQVLHIVGVGKMSQKVDYPNYYMVDYVDNMEEVYAAADMIMCRGGAATVHEISVVGVPAVFIPLAFGNGEQKHNVAELVSAGGALMVEENQLDVEWILANIFPLIKNPVSLNNMSTKTASLGIVDGDRRLADMVFRIFEERK